MIRRIMLTAMSMGIGVGIGVALSACTGPKVGTCLYLPGPDNTSRIIEETDDTYTLDVVFDAMPDLSAVMTVPKSVLKDCISVGACVECP
jgi:hypothetical protein